MYPLSWKGICLESSLLPETDHLPPLIQGHQTSTWVSPGMGSSLSLWGAESSWKEPKIVYHVHLWVLYLLVALEKGGQMVKNPPAMQET